MSYKAIATCILNAEKKKRPASVTSDVIIALSCTGIV